MFIPYGDDIEKRHPPFATIFLMAVNVLVYMYEFRLFQEEPNSATYFRDFVDRFGLVPHELAQGKVLGLFTGMFLHGDIVHLLSNMFTMWLFAWTIEVSLGTLPFLILYLSWGIAASLTHAAMQWESEIPCVGASGAIFGIIGAYFVTFGVTAQVKCLWNGGIMTGWRWTKIEIPAGVYTFFWLLVPQFAGVLGIGEDETTQAGIAWYAHAGGFGAGMFSMAVFGGDAMRRMRLNREGKWEIHAAPEDSSQPHEAGSTVASEAETAGLVCQYCHTPIDKTHKIGETLLRCPNPECARLTYLA